MAEIQNWQKQNMSKNGGSSAPCSMNPKLMPKDPASGLHSKIAKPTVGMGGMVMSNASTKVVPRFADGGMMMQDDATGVDAAVARNAADDANRETATGEYMRGENYGDGTTGQERVDMAKVPEKMREASNDEVRAAMQEGEAKQTRQAARKASKPAAPAASRSMVSSSDESDAETSRLRNASSASSSTQARTIQPAKSAGTYRGMDGKVYQKSPETKSEPVDIGGAISRGASAVGSYLSSLVKSPERKPVTYRGLDGKVRKSGE